VRQGALTCFRIPNLCLLEKCDNLVNEVLPGVIGEMGWSLRGDACLIDLDAGLYINAGCSAGSGDEEDVDVA
jgi:hypothetical protein